MQGRWKAMPAPNSSCLAWVEYDASTMHLGFHNGRTCTLSGVPPYRYHGLLNATSPGWYFSSYRRGQY